MLKKQRKASYWMGKSSLLGTALFAMSVCLPIMSAQAVCDGSFNLRRSDCINLENRRAAEARRQDELRRQSELRNQQQRYERQRQQAYESQREQQRIRERQEYLRTRR